MKALAIDSNDFAVLHVLENTYSRMGMREKSLELIQKTYSKKNLWPISEQLWAGWQYAFTFESPEVQIGYLNQIKQTDDQVPNAYIMLALTYDLIGNYEKVIPEGEKALDILQKWEQDFMKDNNLYSFLGQAYHKTGEFKKEKELYKLAEKYIPDDPLMLCRQAILALTKKDEDAAQKYMEKYIALHKDTSQFWKAEMQSSFGWIYDEAGYPEKAEQYYRKSLALEPDNRGRLYYLINFLITRNRKPADTSELCDRYLMLMDKEIGQSKNRIDRCDLLDTKGWMLHRMGRNKEALDILEKCWNEAPFKVYSIRSHYEEVKKAVESQL